MSQDNAKPLYALSVQEYIEISKKLFYEEAEKLIRREQQENSKEPNEIIFIDEVIQLTGYRRATIYSKVSRFEIPVLTRRKPLTFSRKAILQWLEAGKPHVLDQEADAFLNTQ